MLIVTMTLNGCSTVTKSTLLGITTGAVVGAGSGAVLSQQEKAQMALTSALVMGAVGGITGYFTHKGLEVRDAEIRQETLFNLEKFGVSGLTDSSQAYEGTGRQKVLILTDDPNWSKENKRGDSN
jgi:hypothetical protein